MERQGKKLIAALAGKGGWIRVMPLRKAARCGSGLRERGEPRAPKTKRSPAAVL
jgi:hypothetical protein